ncbi:hypothetical protein J3R82DRAFT_10267 [Butyriboletus roseoflavus]|nr:hypothetical protein J3R82DRAFT_10267 [Butyriboletus roseoflavus]
MTSTTPLPAYSPDTCMFCHQFLRITTDTDTESEHPEAATVIDDVELYCGSPGSGPGDHHTHWTCLIDHAKQAFMVPMPVRGGTFASTTWTTCVVCGQDTLDSFGRFVVDVRNEGGETKGFDFGAILEEELFLDSHPSQVHDRAFHDLVAQGDYTGAIELIAEHDVDINCIYGNDRLTALQKAMFSGDTSGVRFLRSLGATA